MIQGEELIREREIEEREKVKWERESEKCERERLIKTLEKSRECKIVKNKREAVFVIIILKHGGKGS